MPFWHINYFKLKALKKQRVQERHSDPPLTSWKQEIKFPCERYPPHTRRKEDIHIGPEMAPEEAANNLTPLISSYVFTFLRFVALGNLKLFSFALLLPYKFIVLYWRCYVNWNSTLLFWATFGLSCTPMMCAAH